MYDTSILYPIVHDLSETEVDPSSPQHVSWCAGGGCFDLRELLIPCDSPREICEAPCHSNSIESAASEVSVEDPKYVPPSRPERFQDAYVLTRQVRNAETTLGILGCRFGRVFVERLVLYSLYLSLLSLS